MAASKQSHSLSLHFTWSKKGREGTSTVQPTLEQQLRGIRNCFVRKFIPVQRPVLLLPISADPVKVSPSDAMGFCFGVFRARNPKRTMLSQEDHCVFCDIARGNSSTTILFSDEKVVAFPDINPSAFRHYLVIPVQHVPTVNSLEAKPDDYELVNHMLNVGKELLNQDAPNAVEHRFGFHQPPFNSIDHLHLHCLALPFIPAWRQVKYTSIGHIGFIGANDLLNKLKPRPTLPT